MRAADAGRQEDVVGAEAVAVRQDEDGHRARRHAPRFDEGHARPAGRASTSAPSRARLST